MPDEPAPMMQARADGELGGWEVDMVGDSNRSVMGEDGHMRKNILITGASSGLGAEMARQFAALGPRPGAVRTPRTDRLEELRAEILADAPGPAGWRSVRST